MPYQNPNLAPYLQAAYWSGLSPGIDAPEALPLPPREHLTIDPRAALKVFLGRMESYSPHENIPAGEVFSANRYPDGTIITYRQETLRTTHAQRTRHQLAEICQVDNVMPIPPSTLSPGIIMSERIRSGSSVYTSQQRWGVVASQRDTKTKTIMSAAASNLTRQGRSIRRSTPFIPLTSEVKVGRVFGHQEHPDELNTPYAARHFFIRINRLHVMGQAPEKSRGTWLSALIDFIPR